VGRAHRDYLYTDAWVRKVINDLANPIAFKSVTGSALQTLAPTGSRSPRAS
jgi:hypothetical protein